MDGQSFSKQYGLVDVFRLFFAICVIGIHTNPLIGLDESYIFKLYKAVVNMGVPFFYICTGFFVMCQADGWWEDSETVLRKQLLKTVKIYCIWSLVYLPLALYWYWTSGFSFKKGLFDYIRGFFFVGEHYNSWVLWYLLGAIYAFAFLIICRKLKMSFVTVIIISCLISVWAILMTLEERDILFISGNISEILRMFNKLFIRGRIFTGIFYITAGMITWKFELAKITNRWFIVASLVGIVCCSFTSFVGFKYELCRVIATCSLFLAVSQAAAEYKNGYTLARQISRIVYYIHLLAWTGFYSAVYGEKTFGLASFAWTTIISITVSIIYLRIIDLVKLYIGSRNLEPAYQSSVAGRTLKSKYYPK